MTSTLKRLLPVIALLLFFLIIHSRHSGEAGRVVEKTKLLMGTIVEIKVPVGPGEDAGRIRQAIDEAFAEIKRIEDVFSVFKEASELSRVNRLKAGEALKLSTEVYDLIKRSLEYSELTGGAFDITVKPLVDLWNAAKTSGRLPSKDELEAARAKVGPQNIILNEAERTISLRQDGVKLDLGGIAKGYAADRAGAILKASGITGAIVNPGGNMYCLGRRSKNELWKIGIQHPRKREGLFLEIMVEDRAVVTSGDYERYFELGGKRYSHIIDPRTGWPIGDAVVSATVIADNSTRADALATAICVLGPKDGLRMLKRMKGVDAFVIFKDGENLKTVASERFEERYEVIKK